MAVQTISYDDKSYINLNADIPAINKVMDTDMNEIKSVVNNNANELSSDITNTTNNTTAITNLTPVELYNNTSGTTGTVNLSETSANFTYIEIFYKQQEYASIFSSVKVYTPNGKQVSLVAIQSSNGGAGIVSAYVNISGTSITKQDYNIFWTNGGNSHTDKIYITRVIGYR